MIEEPRPILISTQLFDDDENEYVRLLKAYKDVFAWSYKKMSRSKGGRSFSNQIITLANQASPATISTQTHFSNRERGK